MFWEQRLTLLNLQFEKGRRGILLLENREYFHQYQYIEAAVTIVSEDKLHPKLAVKLCGVYPHNTGFRDKKYVRLRGHDFILYIFREPPRPRNM